MTFEQRLQTYLAALENNAKRMDDIDLYSAGMRDAAKMAQSYFWDELQGNKNEN